MTGLVRASGFAGAALLAFVSAPSWGAGVELAAFTTTAALNQAQVAAIVAPAAAPADAVPTIEAPSPVTAGSALAAKPAPAPAPTELAVTAPASKPAADQPGFIAKTVSATVSAVAAIPGKLGGLISGMLSSDTKDQEHECLATAVYYESKGEPLEGQLAVAEVVLNRAASGKFPASVCGVVKQRAQFSFVRRGRLPTPPKASPAWQRAVAVAEVAREKLADSVAANAMSFHATYVAPAWRRGLTRIARIGAHIFYR